MNLPNIKDYALSGTRVLIRSDFNVPVSPSGRILSEARLEAALPTIQYALQARAHVILMSHFGPPLKAQFEASYSLLPISKWFQARLGVPVKLVQNYLSGTLPIVCGEIILLENLRFNPGETANQVELARAYAHLCDLFIFDAFSVAHCVQASTAGIFEYVPAVAAGLLFIRELEAIERLAQALERPLVMVLGGSKLSTKLLILKKMAPILDGLILGGGLANTFLAAQGYDLSGSVYEPELLEEARVLIQQLGPLPLHDVVVTHRKKSADRLVVKTVNMLGPGDSVGDLGPQTLEACIKLLGSAKTILWNGLVGRVEEPGFEMGTECLVDAIGRSKSFSAAVGGNTLSAIERFGGKGNFSYFSTGGRAFLSLLAGESLPALAAFHQRIEADSARKSSRPQGPLQ